MNQPMQPLAYDDKGVLRFKPNAIVQYILDNGGTDLNKIACLPFSKEDRQQFAQLIGYSLGGYSSLSYVVPVTHIFAEAFDVLRGLPSLSKTNKGFAYSKALAFESLDLREKFDYEKQVFNDVTFDDIERYAKIVAYKVANNLKNGFVMDNNDDPLNYGNE